jgi:Tfp pilus assembly protein PilW
MFETPQTKGETSGTGMWVGILVVAAVVIGGVLFYMGRKGGAQNATPAAATTTAPAQSNADAVKDLRVVSTKMDKDYTGTTAMWSVELRNLSQVYGYNNIQYQTTYIGRDGSVLATNNGTIPSLSLDPGDSQSTQFRDALYPSGTVLFNFKITGATATK